MKIALISAHDPPGRGGVAGHTQVLQAALRKHADVHLVTGPYSSPFAARAVARRIRDAGCDRAVMQYTPNLYRWYNPFPWRLLRRLRRGRVRCLALFHEIFMPEYRGVFRNLVVRPVNYIKDRLCLKAAGAAAVTFQWRARELKRRYSVNTHVLPAFSNIPLHRGTRGPARYLLGTFGTNHHDARPAGILEALSAFPGARALFIGDFGGRDVPAHAADVTGYLEPEAVARALSQIRYFVLFDQRGLSTRKGSTAAAFLNGLPVVANRTDWTDDVFEHGQNVFLFDGTVPGLVRAVRTLEADPALAGRIAAAGQALYRGRLSAEAVAERILRILSD